MTQISGITLARWTGLALVSVALSVSFSNAQENLVANGSFQLDTDGNGVPDHWATSGTSGMEQTLTIETDSDGARVAKLSCTKFVGGSPASHAMLCQTKHVAVKVGQWYRLSWRAKARDLQINAVQVALSNTRKWSNAGLSHSFPVGRGWRQYEHVFRAEQDLPAADSRLQFWFASTGTLWLADVVLVPIERQRYEYHPQIETKGVKNFLPNSSFECGTAGWGSYNPEMRTWAGNVFRLIGEIDEDTAWHGRRSMRVQVAGSKTPVFLWDWFDLVEEEILIPLVAHHGWVPLTKGAAYSVSCVLKADKPDVPARLFVRQCERNRDKQIRVGTEWRRFSVTFTAEEDFAWIGVGPDLEDADLDAATMWIDAIQLEKNRIDTGYEPRTPVESHIQTDALGNTFLDPAKGLSIHVTLSNNTDRDTVVRGTLAITDFFDNQVHSEQMSLPVKAGANAATTIRGLVKGRTGFFRVEWSPAGGSALPENLRCMVIEPYKEDDSIFGMNHAYGWPFLLKLAKQAGLTWWRDWSVKWHEVEPTKGQFDFSRTDRQIGRVVDEGLNLELMFPFPSCDWSTTADMDAIKKAEPSEYRHRVMRYACAPDSEQDFRDYVARSAGYYGDRIKYFQVFNEPVYTHYSLPHRLGYEVSDYIRWLKVAAEAIRSARNDAVVVGGMGIWASSHWTHEFIERGGLTHIDILDLHNYPVTADPESFESDVTELARLMRERGEVRPIWLTEFGCYADDDPYRTPQKIGDAAMSRSVWPTEREAAAALIQSAAVFCTHGLRKIFLHAGTCGPINGSNAGGVFFEYGGSPRKILPAVTAFSHLMDADFQPLHTGPQPTDRRIYLFKVKRGILAIAWTREEEPVQVTSDNRVTALGIMGNRIDGPTVELTDTPVYFLTSMLTAKELKSALSNR